MSHLLRGQNRGSTIAGDCVASKFQHFFLHFFFVGFCVLHLFLLLCVALEEALVRAPWVVGFFVFV